MAYRVDLEWATPNGDERIAKMARVSNPKNANNKETAPRLIRFLLREKHFSPFEMVNLCVRIETTRDISRQILRHRSFTFQEFSGRYAEYSDGPVEPFDSRLQHPTNRQSSLIDNDVDRVRWWKDAQQRLSTFAWLLYEEAIEKGIAKELARKLLPEGLTPTVLYVNGTVRSWLHYCSLRCGNGTQREHSDIAFAVRSILLNQYPSLKEYFDTDEQ